MPSQNTNANRKTIVVGADVVKVINIEAGTWEAGKFYRYRFETPPRSSRNRPFCSSLSGAVFCIGHFAESKQIRTFALPAGVLELVDNPDLGSGALRRMGSSPFTRTKLPVDGSFLVFFCMYCGKVFGSMI